MRWRTTDLPPEWYGRNGIRARVLKRDRNSCHWGILPGEGNAAGGRYFAMGVVNGMGMVPICGATATEVDHMGAGDDHSLDALRAICTYHHRKRTALQANAARWGMYKARTSHKKRPVPKHPGLRE